MAPKVAAAAGPKYGEMAKEVRAGRFVRSHRVPFVRASAAGGARPRGTRGRRGRPNGACQPTPPRMDGLRARSPAPYGARVGARARL
jgi:hypothetical protein